MKGLLMGLWLVVTGVVVAGQPNVLVILTDDQGYGDVGCFGAKDLRTPNLDRLVAEGMRFDHFRANSSVCSPTRAALLSGMFPDRVGVPGVIRTNPDNSWGKLAADAVLLPQVLRTAGYRTALIGKWHLGLTSPDLPNERGFEHFEGFLGDMMDDYVTHRRQGQNLMFRNRESIDPQGHATDVFTSWACAYLRERASKKDGPFFLYLAYNAPHDPVQPPADWLARVKQREPGIDEKRAKLAALIEHLDDGIGRVLATLKELGLEENTLVVFSSDNGGSLPHGAFNGTTRDGKGSMYEGGLRVPCAARWPGRIAAGSRTQVAAATMDWFATVLDAAGLPPRPGINAVSLLPVLTGQAQALPERDLYFVRREGAGFKGGTSQALIRGQWKILQNTPTAKTELFNLANDPLESTESTPKEPQLTESLGNTLREHSQRGHAVPWQ